MNKSVRTQAKVGGEVGLNGEFYKGGEFLPSSEKTVKGAYKIKKGTKAEIAPYVWQASPEADMLSIYDRIKHKTTDNRKECEFIKGQGFIGLQLTICRPMFELSSYGKVPVNEEFFSWVATMIEKFNRGERWIMLSEDPFHYKNQVSK